MSQHRRRPTRSTGVSLEIPVLEYLRALSEQMDRDRSYCINEIIRDHARRQGVPIESVQATPDAPPGREP